MLTQHAQAPVSPDPKPHARSSRPWEDPEAEQALAACAAFSQASAAQILTRVAAGDVYDPRCWAVITAAPHVPDHAPDDVIAPWWREHRIADAAGIHRHDLETWCRTCPVATDANGHLASRVLRAADHRARVAQLVAELEDLGVHTNWSAAR